MFIVSLLCLCSCLCSQLLTPKMWHCEKLRSFGGMRCCFSAPVMLSVSGQAPGLDVTLKEVLWDSAGGPQNPLPRFHSYAAATSPEVTQLDSAETVRKWHQQPVAMTTDDKERPVITGELIMEAVRVQRASMCLKPDPWLEKNTASTLAAGSSSSININFKDDWWGWTK